MIHYLGVDYGVRKVSLAALPPADAGGGAAPVVFSRFWKPHLHPDEVLMAAVAQVTDWIADLDAATAWTAVEAPAVIRSMNTSVRMAMMAGALLHGLHPLVSYTELVTAPSWKKHTVGTGRATKPEVMDWLRESQPTWTFGNDDEADALCMALYMRDKAADAVEIA